MAKILEDLRGRTVDAPWFLIYRRRTESLFFRLLMYLILINIAFTFLYPVLYMVSTSMMTIEDFVDPAVYWIPRTVNWDNFKLAYLGMRYEIALKNSLIIALVAAFGQLVSCSMAGYGFGRIQFPGREFLFMLVIFTFIATKSGTRTLRVAASIPITRPSKIGFAPKQSGYRGQILLTCTPLLRGKLYQPSPQ
jgi:hypothetical protein